MRFLSAVGSILIALTVFAAPALAADQSVSDVLVEALHSKGVLDDTTYTDIKNTEASGGQQALDRKLVEIMHNKGLIDDATYSKLSAKTVAVASVSAPVRQAQLEIGPSAPVQAAPERPFDKSLSSLEEGFARLGGDTVKLKIGTWLQGGYAYDNRTPRGISVPFAEYNAINTETSNSFYMRYARLYFNGTLGDKLGFRIMVDGAGSGAAVKDAYVYADYIPYARVTLGQFLTPFGDETWRAPFEVPAINYALASTYMQFINLRDTGLMLSGKYMSKGGWPFGAGYATAIINGNGIGKTDSNNAKDWIGRAWINPFVPGLSVGGSWYLGKMGSAKDQDWQRWGAEFDYTPTSGPAEGLMLRGEYLYQRKFLTVGGVDRFSQSRGWYLEGAYRLKPLPGILANFEPVVRYEQFREDMALPHTDMARTTIGLNYWFNKYCRLMTNYEIIDAEKGVIPNLNNAGGNAMSNVNHEVLTTNVQVWF
jgi:phosphate-selective porin